MRLLVVEDERRLADTLADILQEQKYLVDVCYDGESGLDNAMSGIYDAIIMYDSQQTEASFPRFRVTVNGIILLSSIFK